MKLKQINEFIHKYFFIFLLIAHLVAFYLPHFGQFIREFSFGNAVWFDGNEIKITTPLIFLSFLLFNAGIAVKPSELKNLINQPLILVIGLLANLSVPIIFSLSLLPMSRLWHNPSEVQNLLMGLALIGSMPIAGSSTAWSQNSNGNLALSLGLIVFSTILSPLTTPLVLHLFGFMASAEYGQQLHQIAQMKVSAFLFFSVVIPSILGILIHFILGEKKIDILKPFLKFANSIVLMLLIYSNASIALPQAFTNPDWDFLLLILLITVSLCLSAFFAGWLIAKIFKVSESDKASLMFGLGMNNNGTGLVFSSLTMSDKPLIALSIIFYNLTQQIIATIISSKIKLQEENNDQFNEKSVL